MRALCLTLVAGLWLLAAGPPAEAAGKWTRVRSPHFVFVGDASERDLRRTAEHLEQFRDLMTRALPRAASDSPVPTIVVAFKNDASLAPYKPLYQGRPIALAGYFQAGEDVNYIVVNADLGDAAFETVFHEYSHVIAGDTLGLLPIWLNEGLAQVYQTFETRSGGKTAVVGVATADYLRLLRGASLMPLRELLAVDGMSPVYNEGDRRNVFYAESWALVHYLMFANNERKAQFSEYTTLLTRGVASDRALTQSFGTDLSGLERELAEYIGKSQFPAVRFDFDAKAPLGAVGPAEAIDDVESSAYLGDLLARTRRVDEARAQLTPLTIANPESGRAALALGLLELREGHADLADPLLGRAAALMPADESAQLALGQVLLERLRPLERGSREADDTIMRARRALARSLELSPSLAPSLATFGQLEILIGEDLPKAITYLDRAARLMPARESYRLLLGAALIRQREYDRARATLGPLLALGSREDIRDSAGRLLRAASERQAADREEAADAAANRTAAGGPATASSTGTQDQALADTGGWNLPTPPLRANQARIVGMFTAVDCQNGSVVFTVDSKGKPFRLRAASLGAVDVVTYRQDAPGSVSCGTVPRPLLVQATYQLPPSNGADGQALTIEILPEGYPVR